MKPQVGPPGIGVTSPDGSQKQGGAGAEKQPVVPDCPRPGEENLLRGKSNPSDSVVKGLLTVTDTEYRPVVEGNPFSLQDYSKKETNAQPGAEGKPVVKSRYGSGSTRFRSSPGSGSVTDEISLADGDALEPRQQNPPAPRIPRFFSNLLCCITFGLCGSCGTRFWSSYGTSCH